jgi:hypothetical protein
LRVLVLKDQRLEDGLIAVQGQHAWLIIIDYELWKNGGQSYRCWMLLGPGPCPKQKNRTVVSKHIDNDVFDKHSVNLFKFLPFFLLGYKNQY